MSECLHGLDKTSGVVSGRGAQLSRGAKPRGQPFLPLLTAMDPLHSRLLKGGESPLPEHP